MGALYTQHKEDENFRKKKKKKAWEKTSTKKNSYMYLPEQRNAQMHLPSSTATNFLFILKSDGEKNDV
jgi:hypothetical protein